MENTVSSLIISFATTARHLIDAKETPTPLRARLVNFISELRDLLPDDARRRLDGWEAEIVIASFASDAGAQFPPSLVERHLERHHTLDERQSISEDTSG